MMRIHRRTIILIFAVFIVVSIILNFNRVFLKKTVNKVGTACFDNSHIRFNQSGHIDTSSQWRKLGLATYVFTAYLDDREPCAPVITVMGFGEKYEPALYGTLLLHNGTKIRLGKCNEKKILNPYGDYTLEKLGPYAYLWPLPTQITTEHSSIIVQQVHSETGATKAEIPITYPVYSTRTFGVCIDSPLFGPVIQQTIIESIEINKVLGAEWFTFYIYKADQTSLQVLQAYAKEGTAEVVLNWRKDFLETSTHYFGQTLSINECAYRNMYRVKYLVYADLDEFIVPKQSIGWAAMMDKMENFRFGTYLLRHAFFFPKNSYMATNANEFDFTCNGSYRIELPTFLTYLTRSRKIYPPEERSKYITMPLYTSAVGVHEVFQHRDYIKTYVVPPDFALLHHCRLVTAVEDERSKSVTDERAIVYKQKIVAALKIRLCP